MISIRGSMLAGITAVFLAAGCTDDNAGSGDSRAEREVQPRAAEPGLLARLCPEGALGFARITDLEALDAEIRSLMEKGGAPDEGPTPLESIGRMTGDPELEVLDVSRPLGLVLLPDPVQEVAVVLLLPVSSEEDFRAAIRKSPGWQYRKRRTGIAAPAEGYVAVSPTGTEAAAAVKLRDKPTPLAARLLQGQAAAVFDMQAVAELAAPHLAEVEDMLAMSAQPGVEAPAMAGAMAKMFGEMRDVLGSLETLSTAGSLTKGALGLSLRLHAGGDTRLGELFSRAPSRPVTLLRSLDPGGTIAMEYHYSPSAIWELLGGLYEVLLADVGPERLAMLKRVSQLADGQAVSLGFSGGMNNTFVSHLTDPDSARQTMEEYLDQMDEMLASIFKAYGDMPFQLSVRRVETWQHAGTEVKGLEMTITRREGAEPPLADHMLRSMRAMLGGGRSTMYSATLGDRMLGAMGPDAAERIKALIDRVKAGETTELPAQWSAATAGFPSEVGGVLYCNLGGIVSMVTTLMPPGTLTEAEEALLNSPPGDMWMAAYMKPDGSAAELGLRVNLGSIVEYFSALDR